MGRLRAHTYSPQSFRPDVTLYAIPTPEGSKSGGCLGGEDRNSVRLQKVADLIGVGVLLTLKRACRCTLVVLAASARADATHALFCSLFREKTNSFVNT